MSGQAPGFSHGEEVNKEVTITANFIYVDEFPQAISLLERGLVDVDSPTSSVVPLDDFESAFAALRQPDRTVKALIRIGDGSGKE